MMDQVQVPFVSDTGAVQLAGAFQWLLGMQMLEIANSADSVGIMRSSLKKDKVFVAIHAEHGKIYVTPAEARELARMLVEAADAVDKR